MEIDRYPDAVMLKGLCVAYATAVETDETLKRDGLVLYESIRNKAKEEIGTKQKVDPASSISRNNWDLARVFCSGFGLSAAASSRVMPPSNRFRRRMRSAGNCSSHRSWSSLNRNSDLTSGAGGVCS